MVKKTAITLYGLLIIVAAIFAGCSNESGSATIPSTSILGIRYYMQNVEKYSGIIKVEGVVSLIRPSKKLIALIDMEEYKECKVVTCANLKLPVFWEGDLPAVYDVLQVKGEMANRDGGRVFIAKELKKIGQVDENK